MDEFTIVRIIRLIDGFKKTHGRDIAEAEVLDQGIEASDLGYLVHKGALDKYQVTTAQGSVVNRFKVHRDWRTLKG